MSQEEIDQELLECARYGEDEDLRTMLVQYKANVNYRDSMGNTALHRAAANGHVGCLTILKEHNALFIHNIQGNLPTHWAAQNGQAEALKFLFANYKVDVLAQNDAGRSTLTEAFQSGNTDAIEACLSHESATEDRLLSGQNAEKAGETGTIPEENTTTEAEADGEAELDVKNAVTHKMHFGVATIDSASSANAAEESSTTTSTDRPVVHIRELPITRADNPFGSEESPEDDTTGLGIWPASILLSQWVATLGRTAFQDKIVIELGAGCGLPSFTTALYGLPKKMYLTDIHKPTLYNALHNLEGNGGVSEGVAAVRQTAIAAMEMTELAANPILAQGTLTNSNSEVIVQFVNWMDSNTFPQEKADVLLGSDLVYDSNILDILIPAIAQMLSPTGYMLYVAPITGRDGMMQLVEKLATVNIQCIEQFAVPDEMYKNPLVNEDADDYVLYFYDLAAKAPHTFYKFAFVQPPSAPSPSTESAAAAAQE